MLLPALTAHLAAPSIEGPIEGPPWRCSRCAPGAPLFQDAMEKNTIPQVPLFQILRKFDGETEQEMMNGDKRSYVLTRLPRYLIVHIKRFSQNTQQFAEKNPTIVNFPVRGLEMGRFLQPKDKEKEPPQGETAPEASTDAPAEPWTPASPHCNSQNSRHEWPSLQCEHVALLA